MCSELVEPDQSYHHRRRTDAFAAKAASARLCANTDVSMRHEHEYRACWERESKVRTVEFAVESARLRSARLEALVSGGPELCAGSRPRGERTPDAEYTYLPYPWGECSEHTWEWEVVLEYQAGLKLGLDFRPGNYGCLYE